MAFHRLPHTRAAEFFSASLLSIHERELLVRQQGERFVRWSDVERIERWTDTVELVVDELRTFMRVVTLDGRRVPLGLSPTDLGHKPGG